MKSVLTTNENTVLLRQDSGGDGQSIALHDEVLRANPGGVRSLLGRGAAADSRNRHGRTALANAVAAWLAVATEPEELPDLADELNARWSIVKMLLPQHSIA